jgi:hypothetical protein
MDCIDPVVAGLALAEEEGVVTEEVQESMKEENPYWKQDEKGKWYMYYPWVKIPTVEPLW